MKTEELLQQAQRHVKETQRSLRDELSIVIQRQKELEIQYAQSSGSEKIVTDTLLQHNKKREFEIQILIPSPYFARCDVSIQGVDQTFFVGKFSFLQERVVSWVSSIAAVRFSPVGNTSYKTPKLENKSLKLLRKDEYVIRDGSIVFFVIEDLDIPRTLVYQEHFSNRKTGFVLPEIVSKMEQAQDTVIRSSWRGPMVISGPAGSGKTTLALHRIAYLLQSPETTEWFPGHKVRVFVQDVGTKAYFSALLPELGITNVAITTFFDWACNVLELSDVSSSVLNQEEVVEDMIRIQKLDILRNEIGECVLGDNAFDCLYDLYACLFQTHKDIVIERLKASQLDDVDLTILLTLARKKTQVLIETKEYLVQKKNFEVQRKMGRFPIEYQLCVVDEFQNYLPEQIQLFRDCVGSETEAMVYVGDMKQQTKFGTIRSWDEIDEVVRDERTIVLEKVYRNTQEILRYIQRLGYVIDVPDALPVGDVVQELADTEETIQFVHSFVSTHTDRLIGILAKHVDKLLPYKDMRTLSHVKVLTIQEAQGVEFDTVFLVGNTEDTWCVGDTTLSAEQKKEKEHINRDLLYVGLTRAMRELYVVGQM